MKIHPVFRNEETNHGDKFSCFMLLAFRMIGTAPLGLKKDVPTGCRAVYFDSLSIKEDESLRLFY